jgi:hypothetical protein
MPEVTKHPPINGQTREEWDGTRKTANDRDISGPREVDRWIGMEIRLALDRRKSKLLDVDGDGNGKDDGKGSKLYITSL